MKAASLIHKLDSWIFESYRTTLRDLAVFRILYALCVMLTCLPAAGWLERTPSAFFSPPPGLAALFSSLPPRAVLIGLNIPLALALQMLLLGFHTRAASAAVTVLLLVINSFGYSLGKIDHDILLVLTPLLLAFSGWGAAYSLDSLRRRADQTDAVRGSWCLAMLALVIGIAMFTAGWVKLTTGWLDPNTHSTYGHLLINYAVTGRHTWLADQILGIESFWFWKTADWIVTFMELMFLVAIFRPKWMRSMLAVACLFHFGVWLLYDIVFMPNVVAYGAFVSYTSLPFVSTLTVFLRRRFQAAWQSIVSLAVCAMAGLIVTALWTGKPMTVLSPLPIDRSVVVIGVVFGCGCLLVQSSTVGIAGRAGSRIPMPAIAPTKSTASPSANCSCYYCRWAVEETTHAHA
jgi:uncharacterized membrane protein YphA (DoxX/SURF4 family)